MRFILSLLQEELCFHPGLDPGPYDNEVLKQSSIGVENMVQDDSVV